MSTAVPDDVRGVIPTDLDDAAIQNYLDDAEFENEQVNDTSGMSSEQIIQIEKYLAALSIAQSKDRPIDRGSKESASVTYGGDTIAWLKEQLDKRDPSGELAYNRDTNRYTSSTKHVNNGS